MSFVTGFCQNTKQGYMEYCLFTFIFFGWILIVLYLRITLDTQNSYCFFFIHSSGFVSAFQLHQENVYDFRAIAQAAGKTLSFGGDEEGNNAQYVLCFHLTVRY